MAGDMEIQPSMEVGIIKLTPTVRFMVRTGIRNLVRTIRVISQIGRKTIRAVIGIDTGRFRSVQLFTHANLLCIKDRGFALALCTMKHGHGLSSKK